MKNFVLLCCTIVFHGQINAASIKDSTSQHYSLVGIGTSIAALTFIDTKYPEIKTYFSLSKRIQINADFGAHYQTMSGEDWSSISRGYFYQLGFSCVIPIGKRLKNINGFGFIQNNYHFTKLKNLNNIHTFSFSSYGAMVHFRPTIDYTINKHFHLQTGLIIPLYRLIRHDFRDKESELYFDYMWARYPLSNFHYSEFHNLIQLSLFYQFKY